MPHRPAALLALTLAACPHPLRFGPEGEIRDPRLVLERLDARSQRLRSVKGEARVRVKSPQQSGAVSELIAAQRPASLHLETLNFFGKPVAALSTNGETFALFVEQTATFYTGPATAANVSRLAVVELEPRDVVALLLGDIPRLAAPDPKMVIDTEARAYRLTLAQAGATQELWVATADLAPLRSQLRGDISYDVALSDFEDAEGTALPRSLELTSIGADGRPIGVELKVHFTEREVNPELPASLFALEQPPGTARVDLDAQGRTRSGEAAPRAPLP